MAKTVLNEEILQAAVLGGSFYGGGGGGSPETGLEIGRLSLTLGDPYLVDITDVPDDAVLLTVSAVGAPGAKGRHAKGYHYLKAVEMLTKSAGLTVGGFITNECGGLATVNGWLQSAATGIPLVDCPCNGRAHPTGVMGSMGLHKIPGYISLQAAVGGAEELGTYVEVFVRGSLEKAAATVRQVAAQVGGLVGVARNPVSASFARENGAPGAIARCIEVGLAMKRAEAKSPSAMIEAAIEAAGGTVACVGKVTSKHLQTKGGFDVGTVFLEGGFELVFWNEYMTLERLGSSIARIATFPDLLATLDTETGHPLSTAELDVGREVVVIHVPKTNLILGSGVKDPALYIPAEEVTGKEIVKYAFGQ